MIDLTHILPVINVLLVPALVYIVRIDRRTAQLDTITALDAARIAKLEEKQDAIGQRLAQLEARRA